MSDFIQIVVENKYTDRWRNSIKVNPPPKYRALIQGMADLHGEKHLGRVLRTVIKEYFDNMPEQKRHQLINRGKNHY